MSDETELRREKEHTRKALQVKGYLDWILVDSWVSDQLNQGQEGREEVKGRAERGGERSSAESVRHHHGT